MSNYPANLLASVLAASGDYTTPPQTASEAGTGRFSQEEGWGEVNEQPVSSGGIPPKRTDFNGVLNLLSGLLYWYQQGGIMTYSASLDYEAGNEVSYGSKKYRCIAENGPSSSVVVPTDTTYWERVDDTVRYGSEQDLSSSEQSQARENIDALGTTETAAAATKLATARTIQTNLASTSAASFDGTANITPGVTGILPVANGGTGNSAGRATYLGSSAVGSGTVPIYLNSSGSPTASTSTVGSGTKPVYLSSGKITVSSSTVGSTSTPVYLASGEIKACSSIAEASAYSKATNGYIKFSTSGIIFQWGRFTASSNTTAVTFPLTFPSAVWSITLTQCRSSSTSSSYNIGIYNSTYSTSGFTVYTSSGERTGPIFWMAVGY